MESVIYTILFLCVLFFFFFKHRWFKYSLGKKTVLLLHTGDLCEKEVTVHCLSPCPKIRLCKMSFGKCATQNWILRVRFKNTNETKLEFPNGRDYKFG